MVERVEEKRVREDGEGGERRTVFRRVEQGRAGERGCERAWVRGTSCVPCTMHMLGPSDCLNCIALLRQKKLSGLEDLPLQTAIIRNHTVFTPAANANIPTKRSFTLLLDIG